MTSFRPGLSPCLQPGWDPRGSTAPGEGPARRRVGVGGGGGGGPGEGEVCRRGREAAERVGAPSAGAEGRGAAGWQARRDGRRNLQGYGDRRRQEGERWALEGPTGAGGVGGGGAGEEPAFVKGGEASALLPTLSGRFTEPVSACLHSPKTWALGSGDGSETCRRGSVCAED